MKKLALIVIAMLIAGVSLTACSQDADIVSKNVSKAADNFEINRRIVFFNGITDKYLLEIDGYCSLGNNDDPGRLSVTCDEGHGQYKKHFLGLSDNVSYFVEQVDAEGVSKDHYRVTFRPEEIVPDIDLR